jgi:DNA-binding response OmpR family regulator
MARKRRILIVDDEEAILKILNIKLRVSGYEVIAAVDGQKGLKLARLSKPDLILLDVIMPKMTGFQVLEKLRNRANLLIIAFSAWPENAQKALSLGADDFISKPFDVDSLVKKINGLLDHKG